MLLATIFNYMLTMLLFLEINDPLQATDNLNADLRNIEEWVDKWKILFHQAKKQNMIISLFFIRNYLTLTLSNSL